jgi:hypothetical protein
VLRRAFSFPQQRLKPFTFLAAVEDVDYQNPRGLDRALFLKLAACDWIAERRNLLITGASGLQIDAVRQSRLSRAITAGERFGASLPSKAVRTS